MVLISFGMESWIPFILDVLLCIGLVLTKEYVFSKHGPWFCVGLGLSFGFESSLVGVLYLFWS